MSFLVKNLHVSPVNQNKNDSHFFRHLFFWNTGPRRILSSDTIAIIFDLQNNKLVNLKPLFSFWFGRTNILHHDACEKPFSFLQRLLALMQTLSHLQQFYSEIRVIFVLEVFSKRQDPLVKIILLTSYCLRSVHHLDIVESSDVITKPSRGAILKYVFTWNFINCSQLSESNLC